MASHVLGDNAGDAAAYMEGTDITALEVYDPIEGGVLCAVPVPGSQAPGRTEVVNLHRMMLAAYPDRGRAEIARMYGALLVDMYVAGRDG